MQANDDRVQTLLFVLCSGGVASAKRLVFPEQAIQFVMWFDYGAHLHSILTTSVSCGEWHQQFFDMTDDNG